MSDITITKEKQHELEKDVNELENNINNETVTKEQKQFDELDKFIEDLPEKKGALINVLNQAQKIFGYLPREVQEFVAEKLNLPTSRVFGVVGFYSYFNTKPVGVHTISVCMGTACYVKGADIILDKFKEILELNTGETTEDGLFTLKDVRCLGACGLAPLVTVGEKVYGHVKEEEIDEIIKTYRNSED